MNNDTKLRPCVFCGNDILKVVLCETDEVAGVKYVRVQCAVCHAVGPVERLGPKNIVTHWCCWNDRHDPDAEPSIMFPGSRFDDDFVTEVESYSPSMDKPKRIKPDMGEADWSESNDTILQLLGGGQTEQVQSKYRVKMWLRSLHRY